MWVIPNPHVSMEEDYFCGQEDTSLLDEGRNQGLPGRPSSTKCFDVFMDPPAIFYSAFLLALLYP